MLFLGKWTAEISDKKKYILFNDSIYIFLINNKIEFNKNNYSNIKLLNSTNKELIKSLPSEFCFSLFILLIPELNKSNFRWFIKISTFNYSKNLNNIKNIRTFKSIKILECCFSGTIFKARFIGSIDSFEIRGELKKCQTLSAPLRSSNFVWNISNDTIYFSGAGWGHGIGMRQSGAIGRAHKGFSYKEILFSYYCGTQLIKAYK